MQFISHSLKETEKIVSDFVKSLPLGEGSGKATVVGLYGELGAGKTTFTQIIAKQFGIKETVTSPTFVIEKIYELTGQKFLHLIHIDAYRLESGDELMHLGWKDIIADPQNIILIEWPERVAEIMPEHVKINLQHSSENTREIDILK